MIDFFQGIGAAIRIAIVIGGSGAVFALCIVVICRWLKWAPINIIVNVNDCRPGGAPDDAVSSQPGRGT